MSKGRQVQTQSASGDGNVQIQVGGNFTASAPSNSAEPPLRQEFKANPLQAESTPSLLFPELPPPDIELQVHERQVAGRTALQLSVIASDASGSPQAHRYPPTPLLQDPQTFVRELLERIQRHGALDSKVRELENVGADLAGQLMKPPLLRLLATLAGNHESLWLHSEEPWIPWELLRVPPSNARDSWQFLCRAFLLTRWLGRGLPATRMPLTRLGVVAQQEAHDRLGTQSELAMLKSFAGSEMEVVVIESSLPAIFEALKSGAFDGFHFCGHATAARGDANLAGVRLADGQLLTPQALSGDLGSFSSRRPWVFLNGCHTARGGYTLTRLGGWATQFLSAGAGAFLGAQWAVNGREAAAFAYDLYRQLLSGQPLGRAVLEARAVEPSDSALTRYAYAVWGWPRALVGMR